MVSAFGEELGLAGLMAILLIYGLIVQRGLRTAMLVKDPFSKLLAGGLSFMLALQVFVIVGGVTRLIPLTGITTPFLSQGGSSLVASWMLIALLARLSDTARRPPPRPIQEEGLTQVVTLVNRALRRISIAVLVMFLLLLININYLQGFEPASLATEPGNSRAFYAAQNQYERGSIVTSDGVTIAASKPSASGNDSIKYQRYYPFGPAYAPVTGYDTLYSQTGIEAAENSLLSGNDSDA